MKWLESYLNNRKQRVKVMKNGKSTKSDIKINYTGVPQGSILGPILFILFTNDMERALMSDSSLLTNYADDTNLLVVGSTYPNLINEASISYNKIEDWIERNGLLLSQEKTTTILFRTKQQSITTPSQIQLSNLSMRPEHCTKFLGMQIDEHLNWNNHIISTGKKLNSVSYSIRVISKYLNENCLKIFYSTNFESLMRFGLIFYGSDSGVLEIFRIQKKVIRTIFGLKHRESCRGIFRENQIMTVFALYIYECLVYLFKNRNKFVYSSSVHDYSTRHVNILYPEHRLVKYEKHPTYAAIKFFNQLPDNIKRSTTLNKFKDDVKIMLINMEPYSIHEYKIKEVRI